MKIYKFDEYKLLNISQHHNIIETDCHFFDALIIVNEDRRYAINPKVLYVGDVKKHNASILGHIFRNYSVAGICQSLAEHLADIVYFHVHENKFFMRCSAYTTARNNHVMASNLGNVLMSVSNPWIGFVSLMVQDLGIFDSLPKDKQIAALETFTQRFQNELLKHYWVED